MRMPRIVLCWSIVLASMAGLRDARAWEPHREITKAALEALPEGERWNRALGEENLRVLVDCSLLPDLCYDLISAAQWRVVPEVSFARPLKSFYADDYVLIRALPRRVSHAMPDVQTAIEPHYWRVLQALRTESSVNACRQIGPLLHYIEDIGAPPHANPKCPHHIAMEAFRRLEADKVISIRGYRPQLLGKTDEEALDGLRKRIEGLIEFSKQRADRGVAVWPDRDKMEPILLESALETARVCADFLYTMFTLGLAPQPEGAGLAGSVTAAAFPFYNDLGARIVLLDTDYCTLATTSRQKPAGAAWAGTYLFHHLPPGTYRALAYRTSSQMAVAGPVTLKAGEVSKLDFHLASTEPAGNIVWNPDARLCCLKKDTPDRWQAKSAGGQTTWTSTPAPVSPKTTYRCGAILKDAKARVSFAFRATAELRDAKEGFPWEWLAEPVSLTLAADQTRPRELCFTPDDLHSNGVVVEVRTDKPLAEAIERVWVVPEVHAAGKTSLAVRPGKEGWQPLVERFNGDDNELYRQHVSNAQAWEFLRDNMPRFECPDAAIERTYWFRWWTYRKHIKRTPDGFVITEFLPAVDWAGKYNTISCAAGHHLYEGRWLRDRRYLDDYSVFWFRKGGEPRRYSFWAADAIRARSLVTANRALATDLLPDLIANYEAWEKTHRDANGLFWQMDDRDGMEFSISGALQPQRLGYRATINSYMFGDALAIAQIADWAGRKDVAGAFRAKAAEIKRLVEEKLWDEQAQFFKVLPRGDDTRLSDARELHGYTPWYFNLPNTQHAVAWRQVMDAKGFYAPFGPTTAEQRHPKFAVSYKGHECQWNGPSWPYATSIALTAMANLLNGAPQDAVSKRDYFETLRIYTQSHQLKLDDGRVAPWIDENLNPVNGDWIARTRLKSWEKGTWSAAKGGVERGKDYNHSTYCDLIITGLVGLRPRADDTVEVNPLAPDDWPFFCLDNVAYHGHNLTILWDKTGQRYGKGRGLRVLAGGREITAAEKLQRVTGKLATAKPNTPSLRAPPAARGGFPGPLIVNEINCQ